MKDFSARDEGIFQLVKAIHQPHLLYLTGPLRLAGPNYSVALYDMANNGWTMLGKCMEE